MDRERKRERDIYGTSSRFENFDFLKRILRDSIRHPRLAVTLAHVTLMPTLARERDRVGRLCAEKERYVQYGIKREKI